MDSSGNVKVADFGLSRLQAASCGEPLTAELGTWQWMAPEVVAPWDKRGAVYTEKADVYSFGIVMWECAAREVSHAASCRVQHPVHAKTEIGTYTSRSVCLDRMALCCGQPCWESNVCIIGE